MSGWILGILIVVAAGLAWIRLAPHNRDAVHVEPAEVEEGARAGIRLLGREAPRFPADPETVLATFAEIALNEPRVHLLDGSLDEGMLTFVARSRAVGFADYITVMAVDEGSETKLSVASRPRLPGYDWGVNRDRMDRWLSELARRLG